MNVSLVDFFNNLPPKQCSKCGSALVELADCYMNHCFECMDIHVVSFSLSPRFVDTKTSQSA